MALTSKLLGKQITEVAMKGQGEPRIALHRTREPGVGVGVGVGVAIGVKVGVSTGVGNRGRGRGRCKGKGRGRGQGKGRSRGRGRGKCHQRLESTIPKAVVVEVSECQG